MEALLQQVREAAADIDTAARRSLLQKLQVLQRELEEPEETMQRIQFLVRMIPRCTPDRVINLIQNCQLTMVRLGIDLDIFTHLSSSKQPASVAQLADKTKADANLIRRILRYLACSGYVREEGHDLFSSNRTTSLLAKRHNQAAIHHHFDFVGPILQDLPDYLAETGYRNITDPAKTALHYTYKTDLMPWEWFQTQPKKALYFSTYAESREKNSPVWIPKYPLEARGDGVAPDAPLFVDVGGGFGQQSTLVRETYPHLQGRVIVQDFPFVLDNAPSRDDVEKMPHDFFQQQPSSAMQARFYYLRQVLHDHADEHAAKILGHLKDAMGPESLILIDEIVMPNTGADYASVNMDIIVMAGLAGAERTKAQWDRLLHSVGLKYISVHPYNPKTADAILEVVVDG